MYILARMKVLLIIIVLFMVAGYGIYSSDWFQKKFLYPFPYQEIVSHYAVKKNLDPFLVAAVIRTESKFNRKARSPKGAIGLMQMMPETANWVAQQMDYTDFDVLQLEDPEVVIKMGTWYLASLRKKEFKGNEVLMLAAYNGGRGNVKQWMSRYNWSMSFNNVEEIPFLETREYVNKVLHSKKRYQELYGK